jgi:tetratricopeptide (TPR) repeat protein
MPTPHAGALAMLGAALIEDGQVEAAIQSLQQAGATYEKLQPKLSPDHADLLMSLARAQLKLGRINEAVALSERSANFWSEFDSSHRHTGLALLWQSRALAAAGDTSKAADVLRRAAKILTDEGFAADRALLAETQREVLRRPIVKRQ